MRGSSSTQNVSVSVFARATQNKKHAIANRTLISITVLQLVHDTEDKKLSCHRQAVQHVQREITQKWYKKPTYNGRPS